jgi:hypothetical protein
MNRSVLIIAGEREATAWEAPLRAHGLEVRRPAGRGAGTAEVAGSPSVVLVSSKMSFAAALRTTRQLRKDPATRKVPVVLAGVPPFSTAQRLRLGVAAPDATVPPETGPEGVAAAVAEALQRGKLPPVELTPAQQAGLKYSRLGSMLMFLGVIFSVSGSNSRLRPWFVLLVPLGGLVSDIATGRVDARGRLLSWQGWAALAVGAVLAAGILIWPNFFIWR